MDWVSISNSLFHSNLSVLEFIIRATAIFLFVLLLLRIGGKRQIAQMSPTEFISILLISNAVQNSMNGGDNSLTGGLILAATLIAISVAISYMTFKSKRVSKIFEGSPVLLVHRGKMIDKHLHAERITHDELISMLKRQNIHNLNDIRNAVLEPDGNLTVDFINTTHDR